jgi:DUF2971 family protein
MIEVSKTGLPQTLYKYCPPERIDIISDLRIRFSPPSDFNDTFDSQFSPTASEMESPRLRLARARLRNQFGIVCLTTEPDNHLMWVNYARGHTGFVIGFRTDAPFFRAGGTGLRRVVYDSPPSDSPEEDACFYKSPDWEYEKEWRYVRAFRESEDRLVLVDIHGENLITEIIFGSRMEERDISRIVLYAEEMAPAFFLSTPDHSRRKFLNNPKTVALCTHCQGSGYRMENLR